MFLLQHWKGHDYQELYDKLVEIYGESNIYDDVIEKEMLSRKFVTYVNVPDRYQNGNATLCTTERGVKAIKCYLESELFSSKRNKIYEKLKIAGVIFGIVTSLILIYEFIIRSL